MAWSHRASTSGDYVTTTNWVVDKPTGTLEGDIMVVCLVLQSGSVSSVPSGWTLIGGSGNGGHVYWKACGASEPASWTWSMDTGRSGRWGSSAFTQNAGVATLDGVSAQNETTDAPTTPERTATYDDSLLLAVHSIRAAPGSGSWSTDTGAGWTERVDQSGGPSGITLKSRVLATAGLTGTHQSTFSAGSGNCRSWMVVFSVPVVGHGPLLGMQRNRLVRAL